MNWSPVRVKGHFGEWLQGRMGPQGPVALVTVCCSALTVDAPGDDAPPFDADQLARFARMLGIAPHLPRAAQNFPLGAGAGASTATLVALARAAGYCGSDAALAEACIAIEGASDPLMYDRADALLWASREGRILRQLPPPPACHILGGFWGPPQRTDPRDEDFDDITDLAAAWAEAVARHDLRCCAALASTSARRCSDRRGPRPNPRPDPTPALARDLGAFGWLRAHTGSARGLVFAPGAVPEHGAAALAEAGLTDVLDFGTGGT